MKLDKMLSSAYFIGIVFVLALGNFGLLTIPGIIAAIFCLIAIYKRYYSLAAAVSILAATTSFIAQSLTGWCISCIIAATMFAIAGLLASSIKVQLLLGIPILLVISIIILPSILSVNGIKIANSYKSYSYVSPQQESQANALAEPGKGCNTQIPLLYVSAYCPSCKEVLKQYIKNDPQGDHWQPVMVSPGQAGKSMLKDMGYIGEIYHSTPVSKAVPCLEFGNEKYIGKNNILSVFVPRE